MFITILCIIISKTLTFDNLTLISLFNWYINHPFLFMIAIYNLLNPNTLGFSINFKR